MEVHKLQMQEDVWSGLKMHAGRLRERTVLVRLLSSALEPLVAVNARHGCADAGVAVEGPRGQVDWTAVAGPGARLLALPCCPPPVLGRCREHLDYSRHGAVHTEMSHNSLQREVGPLQDPRYSTLYIGTLLNIPTF